MIYAEFRLIPTLNDKALVFQNHILCETEHTCQELCFYRENVIFNGSMNS